MNTESNARSDQARRAEALRRMERVMGEFPDDERRAPLDVEVVDERTTAQFTRRKITFATEPGDRGWAWLFVPAGLTERAPAMLCLHQTTSIGKDEPAGLGGKVNLHYALELAQRGYVTIAPDYPGYGDYEVDAYAMGYASATMKGIWNHMRAIDVLETLAEVDANRVGCIGHSLGGHNTLFVAAFDERIRVAVTSCGFTTFACEMPDRVPHWTHKGYMPRIAELYDNDAAKIPFEFTDVLDAIAPRAIFTNSPLRDSFDHAGVRHCIEHVQPAYDAAGVPDHIAAAYPDCEHDFPPDVREAAHAFIDRVLAHNC